MEEERVHAMLWTVLTTTLKVIGFLAIKMLSIMFVKNIHNWYQAKFSQKPTRRNAGEGVGLMKGQGRAFNDDLATFLKEAKKNTQKENYKLEDKDNEVRGESPGRGQEELFMRNANELLNKIQERKEKMNQQFDCVKSNLEEQIKELNKNK